MLERDIQNELQSLVRRMSAKGLRSPSADLKITANEATRLFVMSGKYGEDDFSAKTFRGDSMYNDAHAWIGSLKSAEEMKMEVFMKSLGRLIDQGREAGIEVTYVNPLTELMKSLSTNILEKKDA